MVRRRFDSEDQRESSRSDFQPDADLSGIVFDEVKKRLRRCFSVPSNSPSRVRSTTEWPSVRYILNANTCR
jgi:hypothetical protein